MPGVCVGVRTTSGVEIRATRPCDPASRDDTLMPAIDQAFREAGLAPRDLGLVAVSVGPGGFTAVRIAVTAARMIAQVTGAIVVAVPSACVAAASAPAGEGAFAVALASKGSDAHVTRFDRSVDVSRARPGAIMEAADLEGLHIRMLIADAFLPEPMRAWANRANVPVVPPVFDPRACLRVAMELPATDAVSLVPAYPREPEAVRKWRELHPKPPGG